PGRAFRPARQRTLPTARRRHPGPEDPLVAGCGPGLSSRRVLFTTHFERRPFPRPRSRPVRPATASPPAAISRNGRDRLGKPRQPSLRLAHPDARRVRRVFARPVEAGFPPLEARVSPANAHAPAVRRRRDVARDAGGGASAGFASYLVSRGPSGAAPRRDPARGS